MASRPPARPSLGRVRRDWGALAREQRLAVGCALALFVTMFLPWYEKDVDALVDGRLVNRSDTMTAFGAFSFVEAAVLLVAAGVIALFFARAEGQRFHLPFGDGLVTMAAGIWVCILVFIRQIDKPDADAGEQVSATVGVHWGIFVAFLAGLALAYAGYRLHQAHVAEPGEEPPPGARRRRQRGPGPRPPRTPRPTAPADAPPRTPRPASPADGTPRAADPDRPERRPPTAQAAPPEATQRAPWISRGPLPDPHAQPTSVAPQPARPEIDGGRQLRFDEQE